MLPSTSHFRRPVTFLPTDPRLKRTLGLALSAVFSVGLLSACPPETSSDGATTTSTAESPELGSKLSPFAMEAIDYVAEGLKRTDLPTEVHFKDAQVDVAQVNKALRQKIFSFEPELEGIALWTDRSTLAFRPANGFTAGQTYAVKVDLDTLLGQSNAGTFGYQLKIASRDVVSFKAAFSASSPTSTRISLKGQLVLSEKLSLNQIRKTVTLAEDEGKIITIKQWTEDKEGYNFVVTNFVRGDKTKRYTLTFKGASIGVPREKEVVLDLSSAAAFTVTSSGFEGSGNDAVFRIEMDAEVASQQKMAEFVSVKPAIKTQTSYVGRRITIGGAFKLGTEYTVTLKRGVRSKWNTSLATDYTRSFTASDLPPAVVYSQKGVFLTSEGEGKIAFRTTNIKSLRVELKEIYANNLGQFLQGHNLQAGTKEAQDYNINAVGVSRYSKTIKIESKRNQSTQHTLDLSAALKAKHGLYVLSLHFDRSDVPFKCKKNRAGAAAEKADGDTWYWSGIDDYSESPCGGGFWYYHGKVTRPVVLSDIGLTSKVTKDGVWIFATDTNRGVPLAGVKIEAFSYQQQRLTTGITDAQGLAKLSQVAVDAHYIHGSKGKQRTTLKPGETRLNLSTFSVGGVSSRGGVQAFVYTERGVYRPGDAIYLTTILRNQERTFPTNHPVEVRLYNPKGKEMSRETRKEGRDGVYAFKLRTATSDRTGSWSARVYVAGDQVAYQALKIETIVPPRLKLKLEPKVALLTAKDKKAVLKLTSKYLFGAPAANLRAEVRTTIEHEPRSFPKRHPNFLFDASSIKMQSVQSIVFDRNLSDDGEASVSWKLPSLKRSPSDLRLKYEVKVFEKGGRYVQEKVSVPIEAWENYVGIKLPYGQARVNEKAKLEIVLVDRAGKPIAGKKLKVRVYTNRHRWWWQGGGDNYHQRYKTDKETKVLFETEVTSTGKALEVEFTPKEYGELLFEVQDAKGGHLASGLMWTYGWQRPSDNDKSATLLKLKSDKDSYQAGETARVSFKAPGPSKALVTIERGGFILDHFWTTLTSQDAQIAVPIKKEYGPNVYAFVHVYQPYAKTLNDRPIRTYGVVSLAVGDPERKLKIAIEGPKEIRPRTEFSIKVTNDDRRDAQFTIAVVDEGLLNITHFRTPDAATFFYAKQSIGVRTSDMYDQVIGAIWGDITKRFAIGGDGEEERKQVNPVKAKRFEAVALFQGPLTVKAGQSLDVSFKMPNYNGSVRVMVIATHRGAFASLEKTIPVRAPIVLLPTLPRVAGPGDIFDMPVSIFGLKDDVGTVKLKLTVQGPLKVLAGEDEREVTFDKIGEKEIIFRLVGKEAMGVGKIKLHAQAKNYSAEYSTELAVRPASTITSDHVDKPLKAKSSISIKIPKKGLDGARKADLILATLPDFGFGSRAAGLIGYPYGCLEQTTSRAFPQLFLRELFPNIYRLDDIDKNINAAVKKIAGQQTHDGGFYYWKYYDYHRYHADDWGTSYAGHFLIAAQKKGYYVARSVIDNWVSYQRGKSSVSSSVPNLYRLYTLALAGHAHVSLMNRIREDYGAKLSGSQLMLLAGAYEAAGMKKVALGLVQKHETAKPQFDTRSRDYYNYYYRHSYGSRLRDTALELQIYQQLGMESEAFTAYKQIAQKLSSNSWYNTQALAWSLLAVGQFVDRFDLSNGRIKVEVIFLDGKKQSINSGANAISLDVSQFIGQEIKIVSQAESSLFTSVAYDYLPLRPEQKALSENMALTVTYRNEDGATIDPQEMDQGKTFWAIYRVASTSDVPVENVALTQILPAGWEIENTRLSGDPPPKWLSDGFFLGAETYVDFRDDRVMWFFDLKNKESYRRSKKDGMAFAIKLNTIGVGEFDLAPTYAEAMYDASYRARIPGKKVKVMRP